MSALLPQIVPKSGTPSQIRQNARAARRREKLVVRAENIALAKLIITNPVIELIAGIVAISYLNKGSGSWLETATGIDLAAGGEYAGLVAIIGLQQIAPLVPEIINSPAAGEALKALPLAALAL